MLDITKPILVYDINGLPIAGEWTLLNSDLPVFVLAGGKTFIDLDIDCVFVAYQNKVQNKDKNEEVKVKILVEPTDLGFMLNANTTSTIIIDYDDNRSVGYRRVEEFLSDGTYQTVGFRSGAVGESVIPTSVGKDYVVIEWGGDPAHYYDPNRQGVNLYNHIQFYEIYRTEVDSNDPLKQHVKVGEVQVPLTNWYAYNYKFEDKKLKKNTKYQYFIVPVLLDGVKVFSGVESSVVIQTLN